MARAGRSRAIFWVVGAWGLLFQIKQVWTDMARRIGRGRAEVGWLGWGGLAGLGWFGSSPASPTLATAILIKKKVPTT